MTNVPLDPRYEVGALYSRLLDIHDVLGGQQRSGISTPPKSPFVIIFTGEAGKQHGYNDRWDDNGHFHYFGEGQIGDMQDKRGNRAIREHLVNGKRLVVFQMMGHSRPCRYMGEFRYINSYKEPGIPDTKGTPRVAIVFELEPLNTDSIGFFNTRDFQTMLELDSTSTDKLTEVRTKQSLFKRRLLSFEKECRITGIADLRFLRASHMKPWSACETGSERVDGANGLLLTPHADLLFDRGWITFTNAGRIECSSHLPAEVIKRIGLNLKSRRATGEFSEEQCAYLAFHQSHVYDKTFKKACDPIAELLATSKS
ncbi:HNH endonuclease [Stenotrophomonas terrae]|uniref:HNH endonuclease n=1 Tax=Stenotrophomonas terrae TaxID=405446 RepID=UPI003209F898